MFLSPKSLQMGQLYLLEPHQLFTNPHGVICLYELGEASERRAKYLCQIVKQLHKLGKDHSSVRHLTNQTEILYFDIFSENY